MKRHSIVCRFGAGDTTPVALVEPDSVQTELQFVQAKKRFEFGIGDALSQLRKWGVQPSETAHDLLVIAAAVYCADTRVNRASEAQDSWSREVDIYVPVHDLSLWERSNAILSQTLQFLSGDKWRFSFRTRPKGFENLVSSLQLNVGDKPPLACLFSGGLDSFIGAIDLFESGAAPLLISHSWVPNVSGHQNECASALRNEYGTGRVRRLESRIGFHKGIIDGVGLEDTERSRSFLFFSLAAFAASGFGIKDVPICVPENGLISLNVPLDPLRLGSLSTRTTHPHFMKSFNRLLAALKISAHVENPYAHKTKGEMVRECKNQKFLAEKASITMSCSSPTKGRWQGLAPAHCGYCLPCIIRKASMLGWKHKDATHYHTDFDDRVLDSLRAEGDAIRSLQLAATRLKGDIRRSRVLIHKSGPLGTDAKELEALAQVYLRGMAEVADLIKDVQTAPNVTASAG